MSMCYDFQKWTMISLLMVTVTLTVGLVLQYAHGYTDPAPYIKDPHLVDQINSVNDLEKLIADQINSVNDLEKVVVYCFEHADRPNPLQDLRDKGFNVIGSDCKSVKGLYDEQLDKQNKMIANHTKMIANYTEVISNYTKYHFCDVIDPAERDSYPSCQAEINKMKQ